MNRYSRDALTISVFRRFIDPTHKSQDTRTLAQVAAAPANFTGRPIQNIGSPTQVTGSPARPPIFPPRKIQVRGTPF